MRIQGTERPWVSPECPLQVLPGSVLEPRNPPPAEAASSKPPDNPSVGSLPVPTVQKGKLMGLRRLSHTVLGAESEPRSVGFGAGLYSLLPWKAQVGPALSRYHGGGMVPWLGFGPKRSPAQTQHQSNNNNLLWSVSHVLPCLSLASSPQGRCLH